jgi:hypothetical protein
MKVPGSQRVRRWCADCDDFTPSAMDSHAVEYCLRCHPQPCYHTWRGTGSLPAHAGPIG